MDIDNQVEDTDKEEAASIQHLNFREQGETSEEELSEIKVVVDSDVEEEGNRSQDQKQDTANAEMISSSLSRVQKTYKTITLGKKDSPQNRMPCQCRYIGLAIQMMEDNLMLHVNYYIKPTVQQDKVKKSQREGRWWKQF